jgi:uncharacterized protein with GYD domain
MPTYITLLNWTDQGVRAVKESPQRLDAAKEAITQVGGRFVGFYMVFGDYDLVSIVEAPDDETYARFLLTLAAQGNVRTKTLKAFTEDEYRRILASLP